MDTAASTASGRDTARGPTTRRGSVVTRCAGRPPVLMYHGIGAVADDPFDLFITPDRFGQQMTALDRIGLRGVSLGELGDAIARGRPHGLVGLTFDDGYREVLRHATPVLDRHGFTATFFVVSGLLGAANVWDAPPRRALMTAQDVKDLAAAGHEIGSHGASHVPLAGADPGCLSSEVAGSRSALAELLGVPPRTFCYPYGSADVQAAAAVARAGYAYACVVSRVPGLSGPLALPRVGVVQRDSGPRLTAKLFVRGR